MSKIIELKIELCKEYGVGFGCTFNINEAIFTEYDRLMDSQTIIENYRKALKKADGFNMLTLQVSIRKTNDYSAYATDILKSYRLINRSGDIEGSIWNGERYNDFQPITLTKGYVEAILNDYVGIANKCYIKEIKEQTNN